MLITSLLVHYFPLSHISPFYITYFFHVTSRSLHYLSIFTSSSASYINSILKLHPLHIVITLPLFSALSIITLSLHYFSHFTLLSALYITTRSSHYVPSLYYPFLHYFFLLTDMPPFCTLPSALYITSRSIHYLFLVHFFSSFASFILTSTRTLRGGCAHLNDLIYCNDYSHNTITNIQGKTLDLVITNVRETTITPDESLIDAVDQYHSLIHESILFKTSLRKKPDMIANSWAGNSRILCYQRADFRRIYVRGLEISELERVAYVCNDPDDAAEYFQNIM